MNKLSKIVILGAIIGGICIASNAVYAKDVKLKQGSSGEEVKQVQTKLKELGYFDGKVTGYYGQVTEDSVKKFQKAKKMSADGIVGSGTWGALIGNTSTSTNSATTAKAKALSTILKSGSSGEDVKTLQTKLKELGYFKDKVTGYYGEVTEAAVIKYQKAVGYTADGIVGNSTWNKIFGLGTTTAQRQQTSTSRSTAAQREKALLSWSDASEVFSIGTTATVIDIASGIKFNIKRSYGTNHADCETLSADDTAKMKKMFGGNWSWDRKAIILVVDGRQLAASMAGVPHAGVDGEPANKVVNGRSGGYGTGQNLDTVKGNNMSGHFDVHFLNSRTHGTNKVDSAHQAAIKKAATYIENN